MAQCQYFGDELNAHICTNSSSEENDEQNRNASRGTME